VIGVEFWLNLYRKASSIGRRLINSDASSVTSGFLGRNGSGSNTDTEFTAEVIRITRILVHPNADKLEIVRFEMKGIGETAYEVVSQKGQYRPGDLAAYFSVDCLLPTKHPSFAFLLDRLDGKGKELYRLRAARLRGVFSQGLLVPSPSGKSFWDQVADHFGVTYYRPEEPATGGAIGSPGKAKKQPFPIYGVDSLKKLPRLFEEGERVVVTEKIHGTNFRFGWVPRRILGIRVGWRFVVGSHRVVKDGNGGGYYGEDVWTESADRMGLAEATRGYKGYTFYGELFGRTWSGKAIQDMTYSLRTPALRIFDILDDEGKWLDIWTRRNLCADLNFDHVPILSVGPELSTMEFSAEKVTQLAEGRSLIDPTSIREGVVVESTEGPRRKAKYVGQGYLLRKEAA
jgi:RNA ligase (TIGR02306 family)